MSPRRLFVHRFDTGMFGGQIGARALIGLSHRALLLAGPDDTVVVESPPDEGFRAYLATLGLGPARICVPSAGEGDLIERILADGPLIDELAAEGSILEPYFAGPAERALAERLGAELHGTQTDLPERANHKAWLDELLLDSGLPRIETETVERDAVLTTLRRAFAPDHPLIVRADLSIGGVGVWILRAPTDLGELESALCSFRASDRFLIQPLLAVRSSPNLLFDLGELDATLIATTEQRLQDGVIHAGNCYPFADPCCDEVTRQGLALAEHLRTLGYRGYLGIDFIVTRDAEVFAVECNPRLNTSSFAILALRRLFPNTPFAFENSNRVPAPGVRDFEGFRARLGPRDELLDRAFPDGLRVLPLLPPSDGRPAVDLAVVAPLAADPANAVQPEPRATELRERLAIDGRLGAAIETDHWTLDGVDLVEVVREHGTPSYVYGANSVRRAYLDLRDALSPTIDIHFSVKANPAFAICDLLRRLGAGAEIASAGELTLALRAGFEPDRILFAGPGKSDDELATAVDAGIAAVHVESEGEIARLDRIATARGAVQGVSLRVNLDATRAGARIVTGGSAQKFGIHEARCANAMAEVQASPNLSWCGLHFFAGSQFADERELLAQMEANLQAARRICTAAGLAPRVIDLGGGIGVPHSASERPFDRKAFADGLNALVAGCGTEPVFAQTRFVIEPGRALVSAAGVYVCRVLDVKDAPGGVRFAIVDGGIHHALLPITANRYRVVLVNRATATAEREFRIGGPLCTSADQWHSAVELPQVTVGDLIAVLNSGAYGLTASMPLFLSHGSPAEVWVESEHGSQLIRRRGVPEDLLRGQRLPRR